MLAVAHAEGFFPTDVQRKAWRRAGLIPRPIDQLGLGRERGSTTIYPAGAGRQLAALGRLHRRERGLDSLAFLLWWQGYAVPTPTVKHALERAIVQFETTVAHLVADRELSEAGWDAVERLEASPRLPQSLIRVRKRVGKRKMSTVGRLLVLGGSGVFPGWGSTSLGEASDADLMSSAVGIPLLNTVFGAFGMKQVIPEDPERAFSVVSAKVSPSELRAALAESRDVDLETSRAELREFATIIDDMRYLSLKTPDLHAALERSGQTAINPIEQMILTIFAIVVRQFVPDGQHLSTRESMWLFLAGVSLSRMPVIRKGLRMIGAEQDRLHSTRLEAERYFASLSEEDR